jgi:signal transduction histidine kinase
VEVSKVLKEYSVILEEKDIHLENSVKGILSVEANRYELHILLANIIGNAIKYTPHKGKIDISLKKNILIIKDS